MEKSFGQRRLNSLHSHRQPRYGMTYQSIVAEPAQAATGAASISVVVHANHALQKSPGSVI